MIRFTGNLNAGPPSSKDPNGAIVYLQLFFIFVFLFFLMVAVVFLFQGPALRMTNKNQWFPHAADFFLD